MAESPKEDDTPPPPRQATEDVRPSNSKLPPVQPGRLRLLSGVTAEFPPGKMTALMGESGAGKTTLLDVVASYKTGGYIEGSIRINGREKDDKTWKSLAAYCEQSDIHQTQLSVRESIRFAANLRMGATVSQEEKEKAVVEILELLELTGYADMIVGHESHGEGLPKHARKRLTIGVELASRPTILFLDEPTSGLDALSAQIVIGVIRKIADETGMTVVCTIHQPSRLIFESFDQLLLLKRGGCCVYFGPIGQDSNELLGYLTKIDPKFALPEDRNPADHLLDVFMGNSEYEWQKLYEESDLNFRAQAIASREASPDEPPLTVSREDMPEFGQTLYIFFRQVRSFWREPDNMGIRLWWTLFSGVVVGSVYWQQDQTYQGANNRIGALFFMLTCAQVPMMSAPIPLIEERAVFYREIFSGISLVSCTYYHIPYAVALGLSEIVFNVPYAILFFCITYWMVGFNTGVAATFTCLLFLVSGYILLPSMGQAVAFISPNVGAANGLITLLLVIQTLTMGFLIPQSAIPAWWIWAYWINPFRYLLQGMAVNDLHGETFTYTDMTTGSTSEISGDAIVGERSWAYSELWWYCFVVIILMIVVLEVIRLVTCRYVCFLKR